MLQGELRRHRQGLRSWWGQESPHLDPGREFEGGKNYQKYQKKIAFWHLCRNTAFLYGIQIQIWFSEKQCLSCRFTTNNKQIVSVCQTKHERFGPDFVIQPSSSWVSLVSLFSVKRSSLQHFHLVQGSSSGGKGWNHWQGGKSWTRATTLAKRIAISNASDTSKLAGNIWKLAQPTTSVLVVGKTLF